MTCFIEEQVGIWICKRPRHYPSYYDSSDILDIAARVVRPAAVLGLLLYCDRAHRSQPHYTTSHAPMHSRPIPLHNPNIPCHPIIRNCGEMWDRLHLFK